MYVMWKKTANYNFAVVLSNFGLRHVLGARFLLFWGSFCTHAQFLNQISGGSLINIVVFWKEVSEKDVCGKWRHAAKESVYPCFVIPSAARTWICSIRHYGNNEYIGPFHKFPWCLTRLHSDRFDRHVGTYLCTRIARNIMCINFKKLMRTEHGRDISLNLIRTVSSMFVKSSEKTASLKI